MNAYNTILQITPNGTSGTNFYLTTLNMGYGETISNVINDKKEVLVSGYFGSSLKFAKQPKLVKTHKYLSNDIKDLFNEQYGANVYPTRSPILNMPRSAISSFQAPLLLF